MLQGVGGFVRAVARLSDWLAELSALAVVALTAMVTIGVVMRYGFNAALTWADEISSYCLLAIAMLGLAHTLNAGAHIRIDVYTEQVKGRPRQWLELGCYAAGVVFAVLLLLACWARFQNFWQRNTISFTDLHTPLYLPALMLLLGAGAFLLLMLGRTVEHLALMWLPAHALHRLRLPVQPGTRP